MAGDYAVLAKVYHEIGLASFAKAMAPRLVHFVQSHTDWLGRRVLDLGCGTGDAMTALADYLFTFVAVDNVPEMLDAAKIQAKDAGLNVKWSLGDVRQLDAALGIVDLALALDVINDLNSLREIEAMFTSVHNLLDSGKLLLFDMYTLQGLSEYGTSGDRLIYNQPESLTVFSGNQYDYERQMCTQQYIIFQQMDGDWQRSEATRVLRTFPVQAVASLLQRCGFEIVTVIDTNMNPFQPGVSQAPRVVFIAKKL